jgi:hypothetical protein
MFCGLILLLFRRQNSVYRLIKHRYVLITTCYGIIGHLQIYTFLTFTLFFVCWASLHWSVFTQWECLLRFLGILLLCNISFIQKHICANTSQCRED